MQLPLQLGERPTSKADVSINGEIGLTFKDSLKQGPFGWYPYVEGFSANYVKGIIAKEKPATVFDPFGGSGTTCLAAALASTPSYFSELNPFMRFVAETKVNGLRSAAKHSEQFSEVVSDYISQISSIEFLNRANAIDLSSYYAAFPDRDFFVESDLRNLLACMRLCDQYATAFPYADKLLKLAVAANIVKSSNMTRRADLRRRRPDEYKTRVVDVCGDITDTLRRMVSDVKENHQTIRETIFVSDDARIIPLECEGSFDCAITSPPYLNGTNYFRNTKLELWMLGFIASEKNLSQFYKRSVAGGINSVQSGRGKEMVFDSVERIARQLEECAGDKRIPRLVRHYFSDMYAVLCATRMALKESAKLFLDIGDSKFYGVHVPTDTLLIDVAAEAGFRLIDTTVLAKRYSRDKSQLQQVELVFERHDS
jgi:DNA modification methylase